MKHYIDPATKSVYAYEEDGSQDLIIPLTYQRLTTAELAVVRAQQVADALASMPVPLVVTRFQARAALYLAGHFEAVEAYMAQASTPMLAKLAWQDAQEFQRSSPTVLALAKVLGLSDAQLDALFVSAATIKA